MTQLILALSPNAPACHGEADTFPELSSTRLSPDSFYLFWFSNSLDLQQLLIAADALSL